MSVGELHKIFEKEEMMEEKTKKRPNVLLLLSDQQRYDTIAAAGFPHMHTPNLDRLAKEAVVFDNYRHLRPSDKKIAADLISQLLKNNPDNSTRS